MSKDKVVVSAAVPVLPILGIAFIVLKLCGVIAWSWWWVLSPFWIVPMAALLIFAMVMSVLFLHGIITESRKKK